MKHVLGKVIKNSFPMSCFEGLDVNILEGALFCSFNLYENLFGITRITTETLYLRVFVLQCRFAQKWILSITWWVVFYQLNELLIPYGSASFIIYFDSWSPISEWSLRNLSTVCTIWPHVKHEIQRRWTNICDFHIATKVSFGVPSTWHAINYLHGTMYRLRNNRQNCNNEHIYKCFIFFIKHGIFFGNPYPFVT